MTKFLMAVAAYCILGLAAGSAQTSSTKPPSGDPAASTESNPSGSGASIPGGTDTSRKKGETSGRASDKPSDQPSTPATGRQKSGTNAEGTN